MAAPPSSPRVRALAGAIKKAREDRRITQRELARRVGISNAALSYWESGERVPNQENITPILDELRVVGAEREHFLELVRNANLTSNWLAPGFPGMSPVLAGVLDCEVTATAITEWNLTVIPGLLQKPEYAEAMLDEDEMVRMRLARQDILTKEQPVEFTALIHECALREVLVSPDVQAAQLQHLLDIGMSDNVTIQVVQSGVGWHPGLAGSFILYDFQATPSIVHIEHFSSSAFLYEARDVTNFKAAARMVRGVAMSPEDSAGLIAEVMEDMEMR
jgi:transcriptional regulator with XRE-family HTH domain